MHLKAIYLPKTPALWARDLHTPTEPCDCYLVKYKVQKSQSNMYCGIYTYHNRHELSSKRSIMEVTLQYKYKLQESVTDSTVPHTYALQESIMDAVCLFSPQEESVYLALKKVMRT
mgnify:CR=1 FL=1